MSKKDSILEVNLSRLLKRAYEPAPCRQEFREACLQRILRLVGRPRGMFHLSLLTKIAIAAGVLFTIGFAAWRGGMFDGSGPRNDLSGVTDGIVAAPGNLLNSGTASKKSQVNGKGAASQPAKPAEKTDGAEPPIK
ncbi:MAG: hypothetical protein ACKVS6_10090 [Planctomycetota bacterium]